MKIGVGPLNADITVNFGNQNGSVDLKFLDRRNATYGIFFHRCHCSTITTFLFHVTDTAVASCL